MLRAAGAAGRQARCFALFSRLSLARLRSPRRPGSERSRARFRPPPSLLSRRPRSRLPAEVTCGVRAGPQPRSPARGPAPRAPEPRRAAARPRAAPPPAAAAAVAPPFPTADRKGTARSGRPQPPGSSLEAGTRLAALQSVSSRPHALSAGEAVRTPRGPLATLRFLSLGVGEAPDCLRRRLSRPGLCLVLRESTPGY